jgi:hypothetical protein
LSTKCGEQDRGDLSELLELVVVEDINDKLAYVAGVMGPGVADRRRVAGR